MSSTRSRLKDGCVHIAKLLETEHFTGRVGAIFGKTTVHWMSDSTTLDQPTRDAVSTKVFTKEFFSSTAVEAFAAKLRVVCANSLPNGEALDIFADSSNDTDRLVAWNEREFGNELSLVDVEVCPANSASTHLYQHVIISERRERQFDQAILFRLGVLKSLHGLRKRGHWKCDSHFENCKFAVELEEWLRGAGVG